MHSFLFLDYIINMILHFSNVSATNQHLQPQIPPLSSSLHASEQQSVHILCHPKQDNMAAQKSVNKLILIIYLDV